MGGLFLDPPEIFFLKSKSDHLRGITLEMRAMLKINSLIFPLILTWHRPVDVLYHILAENICMCLKKNQTSCKIQASLKSSVLSRALILHVVNLGIHSSNQGLLRFSQVTWFVTLVWEANFCTLRKDFVRWVAQVVGVGVQMIKKLTLVGWGWSKNSPTSPLPPRDMDDGRVPEASTLTSNFKKNKLV